VVLAGLKRDAVADSLPRLALAGSSSFGVPRVSQMSAAFLPVPGDAGAPLRRWERDAVFDILTGLNLGGVCGGFGEAQAQLPDGRTAYINGEVVLDVRLHFDTAGVYTPPITLTYTSPTTTVTFRRTLRHPPIYVIPRARAAGDQYLHCTYTE